MFIVNRIMQHLQSANFPSNSSKIQVLNDIHIGEFAADNILAKQIS